MTKSCHNFQFSIALFLLLCAASLDYLVLSVRADSAVAASSNSAAIPSKTDSLIVSHQESMKQPAVSVAAAASREATQKRKEGELSQIETISQLFSVPRSVWTSDSIASSFHNWLDSWQDAYHPRAHPVSSSSESR